MFQQIGKILFNKTLGVEYTLHWEVEAGGLIGPSQPELHSDTSR